MTNVTIEQAVKGYLVFSAKEGKLFREGRSYLAGKTYHNRYATWLSTKSWKTLLSTPANTQVKKASPFTK